MAMTRQELLAACTGHIDFTAEGAQGVHDGSKTGTMWVIKNMECSALSDANMNFKPRGAAMCCFGCQEAEESSLWCCVEPKYKVGDLLYVREPWGWDCNKCKHYHKASCDGWLKEKCNFVYADTNEQKVVLFPAEDMPPETARTFLRVTAVKAQRAMEISIDEYWDEGMETTCDCDEYGPPYCVASDWTLAQADEDEACSLRDAWLKLFYSIYPPEEYGVNPWCWAYRLERVGVENQTDTRRADPCGITSKS